MSEYPVSCNKCGKQLGYVHATRWSDNYICDECEKLKDRENKK